MGMRQIARFVAPAVLAVGIALAGMGPAAAPAQSRADGNTDSYESLSLFTSVLERIQADYVEDISEEELVRSAIRGMLENLDRHSGYLDPDQFEEMQTQTRGEFGGLGIEVTMEDGLVRVISPIDGTPAHEAGIEPGDVITHLDGEPVLDLSLNEAVERMRGEQGTEITLTIVRDGGEPFDVTITRDVITIEAVDHRREGDVGYIRISTFSEQAAPGVEDAMESLRSEGDLTGLVLDVRNNPGGLLDAAVEVADLFLDGGEIVYTRGRGEDDGQRFHAEPGDIADGLNMVVLINGGSASGSEILTGALMDHERAVVLGTQSFGKGSVQAVMPLPGNGAMRLTTQHYFSPSGRAIEGTGIKPDMVVEPGQVSFEEEEQTNAQALSQARDVDGGSSDSEDTTRDAVRRIAEEDYQLARAIDLLRGANLFSRMMDR